MIPIRDRVVSLTLLTDEGISIWVFVLLLSFLINIPGHLIDLYLVVASIITRVVIPFAIILSSMIHIIDSICVSTHPILVLLSILVSGLVKSTPVLLILHILMLIVTVIIVPMTISIIAHTPLRIVHKFQYHIVLLPELQLILHHLRTRVHHLLHRLKPIVPNLVIDACPQTFQKPIHVLLLVKLLVLVTLDH